MASIEFVNVTKKFDKNVIIEDLNLKIEEGKFTVLVGPSGCGKTTLLRMIAGIDPQTLGCVTCSAITDKFGKSWGLSIIKSNLLSDIWNDESMFF